MLIQSKPIQSNPDPDPNPDPTMIQLMLIQLMLIQSNPIQSVDRSNVSPQVLCCAAAHKELLQRDVLKSLWQHGRLHADISLVGDDRHLSSRRNDRSLLGWISGGPNRQVGTNLIFNVHA